MPQVLCPVLVGRDAELAQLDEALQAARIGRGGIVVVSGEAGIGKTRLARALGESAVAAGVTFAAGRAVEGSPLAFRPFAEAINAAVRDHGPPTDRDLEPFYPLLSTFVPAWVSPGGVVAQPGLVLLEGLHRLVRSIAKKHGLLLVLEDLHWADSDTMAGLEYLADTAGSMRALVACTVRSGVPGVPVDNLARLVSRRVATRIELVGLKDPAVGELAQAALGVSSVPPAVLGALRRRAEGVPFLIEEMLSAYVAAGGRPEGGSDWWITGRVAESLPPSFRDLVRSRLQELSEDACGVVTAAATLGRTFEWPLLVDITGLGRDEVVAGLRAAVDAQLLIGAETVAVDAFSFRHALMREAVLADMLPPERAELAHRAAEAIEDNRPGLPGDWCERAAELREQAGDALGACRLLQESARRGLARGALESAEASLRRARRLSEGDYVLWMGVYTLLCEVLARAGKTVELVEMTRALVAEWERTMRHAPTSLARMLGAPRRAKLHLDAARAGLVGGDFPLVKESLGNARSVAGDDPEISARATSIEAAAALSRGDVDQAGVLAACALAEGERLGLFEVTNESRETLGKAALADGDVGQAVSHFERLREAAADSRAIESRIRAMAQLGALEAKHEGRAQTLEAARSLAVEAGAVSALAGIDLDLGWHWLALGETTRAGGFIDSAIEASESFALPLLPDALLARCALFALEGRGTDAAAAIERTRTSAGPRPDVLVAVRGEAEVVLAIVREEPTRARTILDEIADLPVHWPGGEPWFLGMGRLLRAAAGEDGSADPADEDRTAPVMAAYDLYATSVSHGRRRDPDAAALAFSRADALMPPGWRRQHAHRVAAEAALADGWGDPVAWATEARGFFETHGFPRMADACKRLLRQAGVPTRRAGRGSAVVPASLVGLGVTSREMDVLLLVGEGLSNAEIAARLFLSPRTVETHVKSLMRRCGIGTRVQLVAFAGRHSP